MNNKYSKIATLLAIALTALNAWSSDCSESQSYLMESGSVSYSETVINSTPKEIWPELFNYHLNPSLVNADIKIISGEPQQEGHTVLISLPIGGTKPFYAKIIKKIDYKKVVWKIYPAQGCDYATFQEFSLQEVDNKTIFHINHYQQLSPALSSVLNKQQDGRSNFKPSDHLGQILKRHMEK